MDRQHLKKQAKQIMTETQKPSPLTVGVIFIMLSVVISLLCESLLSSGISTSEANAYLTYFQAGNLEKVAALAPQMMPSGIAVFLTIVLHLLVNIVAVGFIIYLLHCVRCTGPVIGNLLDGFGFWWKIILLNIIATVLVALWSLLLVFPGFIAFYRYRQAMYILIDHPELSVFECLRRSRDMMKGHKKELFTLDLSFLGWMILTLIPYIGYFAEVWTVPYLNMTYTLYYNQLQDTAPASSVPES